MRRPYAGRVGVLALVALVGCGPAHAETRMLPSPGAAVVSTDPAGAANAATSIVAVPAPLPTITTTTVAPDPVSARCPICPPV